MMLRGMLLEEKAYREGIEFSILGDGYQQISTTEAACCGIGFKPTDVDAANLLTKECIFVESHTNVDCEEHFFVEANWCIFVFCVELLMQNNPTMYYVAPANHSIWEDTQITWCFSERVRTKHTML